MRNRNYEFDIYTRKIKGTFIRVSRCIRVRVTKLEARKLHSSVTLNTGSAIKLKYRRTVL